MSRHRIIALLALLIAIAGMGFIPTVRAEEEVLIADSGFNPYVWGVPYSNIWDQKITGDQFDMSAMLELFNAEDICQSGSTAADCQLTPCAEEWYTFVREDLLPGGRCLGYSSMLLKFYANPSFYEDKFGYDHPAQIWPARPFQREMAIDSAKQALPIMSGTISYVNKTQNMQNVVTNIIDGINRGEAPVMLLTQKVTKDGVSKVYGHAIMPRSIYAIGGTGPVYRIYVHDPNAIQMDNQHYYLAVNVHTNQWSYALNWRDEFIATGMMPGTWSGNNNAGSLNRLATLDLGIFHEDMQLGVPVCETDATGASLQASSVDEVSIVGLGNMVFTDPQGRRLGFIGDQLVNEIPGADVQLPVNDPAMPIVYKVPQPYTILVTGNGTAVDVLKFGGNNVLRVEGINPNAQGTTLATSADGRTLTVSTPVQDEISFSVGQNVDPNGKTGWVRVKNVDIAAGGSASMEMGSQLKLNLASSQGTYDLEVVRLQDGQKATFTSTGIPVVNGDTHTIGYGSVDEGSSLPITIENPATPPRDGELPDGGTPDIPPPSGGNGQLKVFLPMLRR